MMLPGRCRREAPHRLPPEELADVSLPYSANLERGRGNPTFSVLRRVADALQAPLEDLVASPGHGASVIAEQTLRLASMPDSLKAYSRSGQFRRETAHLAEARGVSVDEMRSELLQGLAATPRPVRGSLETRGWDRLLDAYRLVLHEA